MNKNTEKKPFTNTYKYKVWHRFNDSMVGVENSWTGNKMCLRKTENGYEMQRSGSNKWVPVSDDVAVFFQ